MLRLQVRSAIQPYEESLYCKALYSPQGFVQNSLQGSVQNSLQGSVQNSLQVLQSHAIERLEDAMKARGLIGRNLG
jgi:hypothetical protein